MAGLRAAAAAFMRRHAADFQPFIVDGDAAASESDPFEAYCRSVESVTTAVWGGQLELRALAAALGRSITVYSAGLPTVRMGEEGPAPALRVAYLRHAYGLGEHYNSLGKAAPEDE